MYHIEICEKIRSNCSLIAIFSKLNNYYRKQNEAERYQNKVSCYYLCFKECHGQLSIIKTYIAQSLFSFIELFESFKHKETS